MKEFIKTIKLRTLLLFIVEIAVVCGVATFIIASNKNVRKKTADAGSKYTVSFNSDGGTKIEDQLVVKNGKVSKPKDPEKKDHMFIAWYLNNETYDFNLKVTKNIKLTAKWADHSPNTYIIKFNSNNGTTVENQIINQGENVAKPEDPIRTGYTFIGWYLDDKEYSFDTIVTKGITLTAKWQAGKVKYQAQTKNEAVTDTTVYRVSVIYGLFVSYNEDGSVSFSKYGYSNNGNTYYVDSVDGYEIYRSTAYSGNYSLAVTSSSSSATSWISTDVPYYYKVRAYKKINGKTIYGDFGTIVYVPARFGKPAVRTENSNGALIIHCSVEGATKFILYKNNVLTNEGIRNSFMITEATNSKYSVIAYQETNSYRIYGSTKSELITY